MLFSGSLHHPQTRGDTLNQLYLLLLLVLVLVSPPLSYLAGPRGDHILFSHFLTHKDSPFPFQVLIYCPLTFHWLRQSIHFSEDRANYPGLFCPPPLPEQLFTEAALATFQISIYIAALWGPCQLHSRNAGPSISNWLLWREGVSSVQSPVLKQGKIKMSASF